MRERVKEWRRRYGRAYNAGSNWENGQNYQTPGGTDNPIEGTLDAVRFLVAKKDVEGSDSGVVKFRYKHAGWGDILVHVKGKTK